MIDPRSISTRWATALIVVSAVLLGVGMGAVITVTDHWSDGDPAEGVIVALVGWAFVGAGLVAAFRVNHRRFGALMIAAGFLWMARALEASNSDVIFTIGGLIGELWIALLFHMLAAFPTGHIESRLMRVAVMAIYIDVTLLEFVHSLVWSPSDSPENLLAFFPSETASDVMYVIQAPVIGSTAALVGAGILVHRWRTTSRAGRRALAPVLVTGAVAVGLLVANLVADAVSSTPSALEGVAILAIFAIPFAFLVGLLRGRLTRAAVSDLVLKLGETPPGPGELEAALGSALHDPSLRVAYWVPASDSFVDGEGDAVEVLAPSSGRAVRILERDGERVAALIHDAALVDAPTLLDSVAATAGIALENERLRVELRAQLAEVRRSRARLVETADSERRRLERDLHDGAQQRLLGIGLALQLAQSRLNGAHPEVGELLTEAGDELRAALDELRELARGIHPAILTDQGLAGALPALAERTTVPVVLEAPVLGRLPAPVEAAAYFVVSEALANVAKYAKASSATVSVDDGVGGADLDAGTGLRGLLDRVHALDGELEVKSEPGEGTRVHAEIPCA